MTGQFTLAPALRNKESQDETQFTTKIDGFLSFIPRWVLMYSFAGFSWISPCVWPNSGFWCCVFLTLWITLMSLWNKIEPWTFHSEASNLNRKEPSTFLRRWGTLFSSYSLVLAPRLRLSPWRAWPSNTRRAPPCFPSISLHFKHFFLFNIIIMTCSANC